MVARRELRIMAMVALVAIAAVLAQSVAGLDAGLLHLAPALVLLLPLFAGRYVGEEQVAALAAARRRPRAPARASGRRASCPPRAPRVMMARGSALLAAGLAERGPPARLAAI